MAWARTRTKEKVESFSRLSQEAYATYQYGVWVWYVGSYPPLDTSYVREYKSIQDDWNRSSDRSATRNVRAVTRSLEGTGTLSRVNGDTTRAYRESAIGSSYLETTLIRTTDYSVPPSNGFGSQLQYTALESIANGAPQREALQGIPFLGEFRETVAMVRNPISFLKGIQPALRRLTRRRKGVYYHELGRKVRGEDMTLGDALRVLGFGPTSNGWLQWSYGWKPLMGDLARFSSLANSFSNQYSAYVSNQRGVGTLHRKTTRESTYSVREPATSSWTGVAPNGGTQHEARCINWYRYTPAGQTMSKARFLANKIGLTPGAILPAAWELTRLSFVVDWFIPVGDVLSRITATPVNFDVVKQQYDYTTTTECDLLYRFPTKPIAGSIRFPQWATAGVCAKYSQKVYERHGYPFLSGPDPGSSWFTTNRAVSALALIAQALKLPIPNRGK